MDRRHTCNKVRWVIIIIVAISVFVSVPPWHNVALLHMLHCFIMFNFVCIVSLLYNV